MDIKNELQLMMAANRGLIQCNDTLLSVIDSLNDRINNQAATLDNYYKIIEEQKFKCKCDQLNNTALAINHDIYMRHRQEGFDKGYIDAIDNINDYIISTFFEWKHLNPSLNLSAFYKDVRKYIDMIKLEHLK